MVVLGSGVVTSTSGTRRRGRGWSRALPRRPRGWRPSHTGNRSTDIGSWLAKRRLRLYPRVSASLRSRSCRESSAGGRRCRSCEHRESGSAGKVTHQRRALAIGERRKSCWARVVRSRFASANELGRQGRCAKCRGSEKGSSRSGPAGLVVSRTRGSRLLIASSLPNAIVGNGRRR